MRYLVTAQSHFRAMALLTRDDLRNGKIADAKQQFAEHLDALERMSPAVEDAMLRGLRDADGRFGATGREVQGLYERGAMDKALEMHMEQEHEVSHELEDAMSVLIQDRTAGLLALAESTDSIHGLLQRITSGLSLAGLMVAVLTGIVLSWAFIRPLRRINAVIGAVAEGDFSQRVDVLNRDEFGEVAQNINATNQRLGELYGDLERELAERQRAEETLERRATELAAVNQELEAFSYSVSHDLRAPLRSIDGFSQALLEDYADALDDEGKDHLNRVRSNTQRMGELIDDLLSLSRVTRSEMRWEQVDLSGLAQTIAAELREREPERQVEFAIADGVTSHGDSHLLRVALENLLGNAWKFTGKHPSARIEFGATSDQGQQAYFVRDDGAGFDMTYADKLFGAFQRLHPGTDFTGTGIGLATVQRVIHRHGGRIWAEGAVEQGATFFFTLA